MKCGETIGDRFVAERLVGAGGMGQVFLARDRLSGELVAIKTILSLTESGQERFGREARLLAQLRHPGLVRYVAHGQHEGAPYLAMEWLEGEDLSSRLRQVRARKSEALLLDEVLSIGRRIAGALGELHLRGIVHRDVKPGNVFLVDGSAHQAKLLDLGVARGDQSGVKLTGAGELVGSPCYMSPEQAEGKDDVAPTTDVWALGCVLYECLTGRPPFQKSHTLALLASIALDEPAVVSELRPETPPELEELVLKMLNKRADQRFLDAGEVLDALSRVSMSDGSFADPNATRTQQSRLPEQTRDSRPSLTRLENRVCCALLVGLAEGTELPLSASQRKDFETALTRLQCELREPLDATRALLVTPRHGETPKEQAFNLARAAWTLCRTNQEFVFSLVTGRTQGDDELSLGETVERAVRRLSEVPQGYVLVDAASHAFLETRFDFFTHGAQRFLSTERYSEGVRTLLGKVTPWVGRHRELNLLLDTYRDAKDEREARALLVTAPAGMGKTRLRHEFLEALELEGHQLTMLRAQGDALSAGSPFVMLGPALRRLAGILDGEPLFDRRTKFQARFGRHLAPQDHDRIIPFLGEMVGIPAEDAEHPAMRAARKDPALLREAMRAAFVDWLRAECSHSPVLIVLEDLHWGDLPSVQYLDAALGALWDCPLLVLALARPEIRSTYPGLWQQHNIVELRLHRLSKRASAELVHSVLGKDAKEHDVHAIVEKADGNAFFLEELIRFAAEGRLGPVPDNVLGMVQTRLHGLDPEERRVLRAASIFGEVFWEDGVRTLIGECDQPEQRSSFQVGEWLTHLCDLELVRKRPSSRLPNQVEYQFRHALVHEAAHETLTDTDSELGHRLAGDWLVEAGEQDSLVLAEHFRRGGRPEDAIVWFARAAEQAFEGSDFRTALSSCEEAIGLGAEEQMLGRLRALQSQASYWSSDYEQSKNAGQAAIQHLPPGSQDWFRALGSTLVSGARVGDGELVHRSFRLALETACLPGAKAAQLICLCRGTFQLIFGARLVEADRALERIAEIAGDLTGLDALTVAQVHHVRGVRAAHLANVGKFLGHLEQAIECFEVAGDVRNVELEQTTVAWCYAEFGQVRTATSLCEHSVARCARKGSGQALTYAKVNLGYILSLSPSRQDESRELLQEAIAECVQVGNVRLEGWARAHLSRVEQAGARSEVAEHQAGLAAERLRATPGLQAFAESSRARALLALGRSAEALVLARGAMETHRALGGLLQGDAMVPVVLAECLNATGHPRDAQLVMREAHARLQKRALELPQDEWRESFWELPDSQLTARLFHEWD